MKTKTIELYKLDELPADVRAKVIDRERNINTEGIEWYDFLFEEWTTKLEGMGFNDPNISFTGFWSQGDGASFTCKNVDVAMFLNSQKKDKGRFRALLDAIGNDEVEINASIDRIDHHYNHEYTVKAETEIYHLHDEDDTAKYIQLEKQEGELRNFITETLRALSRQIYRELEKEYERLTSDEAVIDTIKANKYTFTASGRMEND